VYSYSSYFIITFLVHLLLSKRIGTYYNIYFKYNYGNEIKFKTILNYTPHKTTLFTFCNWKTKLAPYFLVEEQVTTIGWIIMYNIKI